MKGLSFHQSSLTELFWAPTYATELALCLQCLAKQCMLTLLLHIMTQYHKVKLNAISNSKSPNHTFKYPWLVSTISPSANYYMTSSQNCKYTRTIGTSAKCSSPTLT
eukprot:746638-Hanusia_phi.AAC.2